LAVGLAGFVASPATAVSKEGAVCKVAGQVVTVAGKNLVCKKVGKKLKWVASTATTTTTTVAATTTITTRTAAGCAPTYKFVDLSLAPGAGSGYAKPKVAASCSDGTLTVSSNGMIGYTFVATTPNALKEQAYTWKVTTSPKVAASATSIKTQMGTVAFTVTGIPIFGPMEGPVPPQEAFGDPGGVESAPPPRLPGNERGRQWPKTTSRSVKTSRLTS